MQKSKTSVLDFQSLTPRQPEAMVDLRLLRSVVSRAYRAGRQLASGQSDREYSKLMLDDRLSDDQRYRLGFASHAIMKAFAGGRSVEVLWADIQRSLGATEGKPLALRSFSLVETGLLAFLAGVSGQGLVHAEVTDYIRRSTDGYALMAGVWGR